MSPIVVLTLDIGRVATIRRGQTHPVEIDQHNLLNLRSALESVRNDSSDYLLDEEILRLIATDAMDVPEFWDLLNAVAEASPGNERFEQLASRLFQEGDLLAA